MENFIVSARKYRPASFEMVVGQDTITNTLKSAISNKHLAQAYLFCGPRGVGKTTCARIFAKTINCSNITETGEACDKCESCQSFNSLRSFNIHELDAASNNKVEDIRSLNDQVRIPPQVGKYSIYIIDEVHMLSSSAFNAFLKTLEEPPSHAIFILATTEKHKIIPTILSRCQIFDFNRIRIEDIVNRLLFVANKEGINASEEAIHVIAQKADGALRDALSIFDQVVSLCGKSITYKDVIENLNVLDFEYYFKMIDAALLGDVSTVLITYNEILEKGFDGHNFISGLNSHLRDLLVCKDEVTIKLLEATTAVKRRYLEQTRNCSLDFLYKALEIGNACDLAYKSSKNQRLHAELSLIRFCRLMSEQSFTDEKKKSDKQPVKNSSEDIPLPSKSEISRVSTKTADNPIADNNSNSGKHNTVIEKEAKVFSIKNLIAEPLSAVNKITEPLGKNVETKAVRERQNFSSEAFYSAWPEFTDQLKGEGNRIVSMFKTVRPEVENDSKIKIHLDNTAQKDVFVLNYKHRLLAFLEERFILRGLEIEASVDSTETNNVLYSDEQKSNYLFSKYPVLKEIKKSFNLDIN